MNAPFVHRPQGLRSARLDEPDERARIEAFVAQHAAATPFHRPAWLQAVAQGTGNPAHGLIAERDGEIAAWLPLSDVQSPIFGRVLASSGFAVGGGVLAAKSSDAERMFSAAEELAARLSVPTIELRGGELPLGRGGWQIKDRSHCGFIAPLAADDEAQLLAIPRKQRAEVRKGLKNALKITVGNSAAHRGAHYAVYAESVRNLGTPVFPRALFDAVLDRLDADILTVHHGATPIASVLTLYHAGAALPYWGGGTARARALRANDLMYFELMRHARERGCAQFDFGRSKTGSGAFHFKRNWGFEPAPLRYASWTAPGGLVRDADPRSQRHSRRIALWKRLPLPIANKLGPAIARGLG